MLVKIVNVFQQRNLYIYIYASGLAIRGCATAMHSTPVLIEVKNTFKKGLRNFFTRFECEPTFIENPLIQLKIIFWHWKKKAGSISVSCTLINPAPFKGYDSK